MSEAAKVFEDPLVSGDWCVEWEDGDRGVELTILANERFSLCSVSRLV